FLILAFSSMLVTVSSSACGSCMQNNVACLNTTHFKVCVNGVPLKDGPLPCGNDKICTELLVPCWSPSEGVTPACPENDVNCRSCNGVDMFVCTSRTTFQVCNGSEMSPQVNTCPDDTVCSIDSGKICVKECELPGGKYECDPEMDIFSDL
ncbi:GH16137, partial [Drosophila grimshawi]